MDAGPSINQTATEDQPVQACLATSVLAVRGTQAGTLLDYLDVTEGEVREAKHGGLGCMCQLCKKLKNMEDSWIMKLGCFYHPGGLNKRDEFKNKVRIKY